MLYLTKNFIQQTNIYNSIVALAVRNTKHIGIICITYDESQEAFIDGKPFEVLYRTNKRASLDRKTFTHFQDAQSCAWNLTTQMLNDLQVQEMIVRDFILEYSYSKDSKLSVNNIGALVNV